MDYSFCRHDEDGNAVGVLRLPSQLDADDTSRPNALNWKRADGLLFRMFFHARSNEGDEWAEVGVDISEFSGFKYADCRLHCRVFGEKSETVVESDREQWRFVRGEREDWTFRVPRRRLEDAQAKCGPLFAEFKLQMVTNDRLRYALSPLRNGNSNDAASIPLIDLTSPERPTRPPPVPAPVAPPQTDGEWSTFYLHVPNVGERASFNGPRLFDGRAFVLRYFPPDAWCKTANFEFVLTRFNNHQNVCFAIKWVVENKNNHLRFLHQEIVRFAHCACSWGRGCRHKPVNKALFRVDAHKLRMFAVGHPVRLVVKLRVEEAGATAFPSTGHQGAPAPPVHHQGFENAPAVHRWLPAGHHEPNGLPNALEAARALFERTAAAVPPSRAVPRLQTPIPPPPNPFFPQTEVAGSHSTVGSTSERSTASTSISPTAIVAPPPSPASTPELPLIRITPFGARTTATVQKTKEISNGSFLPPFEHRQKTTRAEPIDMFGDKRGVEGGESVASLSPAVAVAEGGIPSGIKQETHNAEQTTGQEQRPHVEQPTKKPTNGAAVKVELGEEKDAEGNERLFARKRLHALRSPNHNERSELKRQRTSEENVEEKTERPNGHDPSIQGRLLTIVVGGKEFEVERDLVIDESGFFAKRLAKQEDPSAGLSEVMSVETMAAVVEWMQTKHVAELDGRARELYAAAKLLGMPDLQKTCVEAIKRTCKRLDENHAAALIFAAEYEDAELLKALDFVWERPELFRKVMKSDEFRRVFRERPGLMEKIVDAM
ncbi:hypothetical protein M3Y99_01048500 [Aphelenchoides fujianensis]|nr:hypothetical protein M3Y99_01048500 [Aphelenchoides fujianensis]